MRKTEFANGEYYHIYNRGVEKRDIFLDVQDYFRAIHALYTFNDLGVRRHIAREISFQNKPQTKSGSAAIQTTIGQDGQGSGQGSTLTSYTDAGKHALVEIIAFCLMPNHYHLLLRQKQKGGIVKFMQKFGTGYTMYFNKRYDRNGVLFQGKFKSILVDEEKYLLTLLNYIHLNPVDMLEYDWKEKGIKNWQKVHTFLEKYRWSSYQDYIGIKNFPSIIDQRPVIPYFHEPSNYRDSMIQWLKKDFESIRNLTHE